MCHLTVAEGKSVYTVCKSQLLKVRQNLPVSFFKSVSFVVLMNKLLERTHGIGDTDIM